MKWGICRAAVLLFTLASVSAGASPVDDPVPPDATLVREVQGGGAQVYACRATNSGPFGWMLIGPRAVLINDDGSDFGTHSAGPTWTAIDGSIVGADGAHPVVKIEHEHSVPTLLLRVDSSHGEGILSGVRFVSRSDTEGGLPPSTGCDAAHADATVASHYSAVYKFYR